MLKRQRVLIGHDDDGLPIYKRVQAQTEDELNDRIVMTYIECGRITEFMDTVEEKKEKHLFRAYAEKFMELYKIPKLKPRTLQTYKQYLNAHILPTFGDRYIENITTADVQAFLNERQELSKKSLKNYLSILKQILHSAVEDKIIAESPAESDRLMIPSNKGEHREALTAEEEKNILEQMEKMPEGREKLYLSILLYTGMRRGEILGLKWEDIDLDGGMIHIERNVTHPKNQPVIGTPKTENGKRDIPILLQLKETLENMKDKGFVFGGEKPLSLKAFDVLWKKVNEAAELHGATSHVFRHTFVTRASEAGVNPKALQAIIGHADFSTTMNIYTHAQQGSIMEAGSQIGRMMETL